MAFNLQLQPVPRSSRFLQQRLQPTQVQAFSKGPQIQEAILKALSQGLSGYFAGRERRRSEGVRDRLRDVIAGAKAPSGWVNPDEARSLEGQFAQLSPETKLRGRVPVGQDILAAARAGPPPDRSMDQAMFPSIAGELAPTDAEIRQARLSQAMQPGGSLERYDPAGGPVVPMTAFRPDTAVLDDPTQLRGKEALFSAIATDPQLQSLVGSDIDPITQIMVADLMQGQPRMLNSQELQDLGFAAGTVAQVNPDGTYNIIQDPPTPVKPTDTFRQASAAQLHQQSPNVFNAQWLRENKGTTWNINETTSKMTKMGGSGQVINFPGPGGPVSTAHQLVSDEFTERKEASATAETLLNSVDSLEALLETGFEPGPGEEWRQRARNIAIFLGMSDAEIETTTAQHQSFRAFANDVVLPRVKELGARPTDKDLQFIIDASPQLGNTVAGNRLILKSLRIMAEKRENEAQAWMDFLDITKDSTDPLYKKEWEKYAIASSTDVTNKRGSNWDHTGNARLMSFWNKYRKLRADQFQEGQKDRIGTLRQAIEKVSTLERDGLSKEIIDSTLRDSGLILPIPTRQ